MKYTRRRLKIYIKMMQEIIDLLLYDVIEKYNKNVEKIIDINKIKDDIEKLKKHDYAINLKENEHLDWDGHTIVGYDLRGNWYKYDTLSDYYVCESFGMQGSKCDRPQRITEYEPLKITSKEELFDQLIKLKLIYEELIYLVYINGKKLSNELNNIDLTDTQNKVEEMGCYLRINRGK